MGYAFGTLWSTTTIIGPVETFRGLLGPEGIFNGTYPADWNDNNTWTSTVIDSAYIELESQFMWRFISTAIFTITVFIGIIFVVKDSPEFIPSRASRLASVIQIARKRLFHIKNFDFFIKNYFSEILENIKTKHNSKDLNDSVTNFPGKFQRQLLVWESSFIEQGNEENFYVISCNFM